MRKRSNEAADTGDGSRSGIWQYRRATRRHVFLAKMEQIVPWPELCAVIEPHYPKAGKGRPPVGHIGVDSRTGLAHSAAVTAANVHDKHLLEDLLHGDERRVYGDSACASQRALILEHASQAKDFTNQQVRKRGEVDEAQRRRNRSKSRIRARVEHVFAVVKRLWGFAKVRYRGRAKNATRSFVMFGLANLYPARAGLTG